MRDLLYDVGNTALALVKLALVFSPLEIAQPESSDYQRHLSGGSIANQRHLPEESACSIEGAGGGGV